MPPRIMVIHGRRRVGGACHVGGGRLSHPDTLKKLRRKAYLMFFDQMMANYLLSREQGHIVWDASLASAGVRTSQ